MFFIRWLGPSLGLTQSGTFSLPSLLTLPLPSLSLSLSPVTQRQAFWLSVGDRDEVKFILSVDVVFRESFWFGDDDLLFVLSSDGLFMLMGISCEFIDTGYQVRGRESSSLRLNLFLFFLNKKIAGKFRWKRALGNRTA